jgi:hypothetical protein
VPRVIARGLRGLSDGVSWRLRRSLIEAAPNEVALSLTDQAAEAPAAWTLRELLAEAAPAEVASSLRGSMTRPPGRCATSCTTASPTPCWHRWGCSTARGPGAGASAGRANAARWTPPSPPT